MPGDRMTSGGRIDRSQPVNFTFNGRSYQGFAGDTLASALLANGVRLTARSFKYHRPRGIIGSGVEEPATLVELMGENASGNRPATTVPLAEGLQARSVNCWPSPAFDLGAINQVIGRFIPAGFYYKTFKWPGWHLYEPSIRKAAGLAAAPSKPPATGHFENRFAHCDVLIAGAGPAGLMAALVAGRAGLRVMIADEGVEARRQSAEPHPDNRGQPSDGLGGQGDGRTGHDGQCDPSAKRDGLGLPRTQLPDGQ